MVSFGCALNFDEKALARHDEIHIYLCPGIFLIIQIQEDLVADHPDTDGGNKIMNRDPVEQCLSASVF